MKATYPLFAIIIMLAACEKEESMQFTDTPIIEAYLSPGDYFNVKISRQIPYSSDVTYSTDNLDALEVQVDHNDTIHTLTPVGNGVYVDSSIMVGENDNYDLTFHFNSKDVAAYTYIPSKPQNAAQSQTEISVERIDSSTFGGGGGPPDLSQPDPIKITWDNPDNSYYLILVENTEATLDPIRDFGDEDPPAITFRKSPTSSNTEEIRSQEFQYFGTHRIVIYHVLADYAALYDQNSSSSQNLTNPSTSISNGYGIFTGLNADTLWLEVKED